MTDVPSTSENIAKRIPWNKGKIVGAKRPLPRPSGPSGRGFKSKVEIRNLALFNVAIDSKLRGCDVVSLKVNDVAPSGYAADQERASGRRRQDGRSNSNLLKRPGKPSMTICGQPARSRAIAYSPAAERQPAV